MSEKFLTRMFVLLITTLIFVSCDMKPNGKVTSTVSCSANESPCTLHPYTIVDKKESILILPSNEKIKKIVYTVDIQKELTEYELDEIADVIECSESCKYVFIEYYLPMQVKSSYNYAISVRTPVEQYTKVNYLTPPVEELAKVQEPVKVETPYDGCKVFGKWNMMGAVVIVYQKENNCYMVNYYGGSNYGEPERFIKTTFRGCTAFKNAEDPNDIYVINRDGNLEGYYEGDLACTFSQAL